MEYYNNSNHQEKKLLNGYTRLIFLSIKLLVIYIPKKYDNKAIIPQSTLNGNSDITIMNRMKQCIHLAIHLAVCSFGYSGYLQVRDVYGNITSGGAVCDTENDSKGRYLNQLKEAATLPTISSSSSTNKSTRKKTMNPLTVSMMKISNEDIINVIEIYQLKAMVRLCYLVI